VATSTDGASSPEDQFRAQLKAVVQEVWAENAPALVTASARQALDIARQEIDQRVKDARAETDAYRAGSGASGALTSEPTATPPAIGDTPKNIADSIRWAIASLPQILSSSLDSYDKLITIRMKQQNPFVMFGELQKTNPLMASFLAQTYAPDPLQTIMPQLLAKNSLETANAVVRTLMRQGVVPRGGRLAIDPFGEDSEEPDEEDSLYRRPRADSEPQTAAMNKSPGPGSRRSPRASAPGTGKGARPTTLREALA